MWSAYQDGISLAAMIATTIEDYAAGREAAWEVFEPGTAKTLEFVDALAKQVLDASDELLAPGHTTIGMNWEALLLLLNDERLGAPIVEKIEIVLAGRFAADTDRMASRCREIARELTLARPNEAVMKFLRRVSRCYVAGFLPECVIVSRAVLENAVNEVLQVRRIDVRDRKGGNPSMRAKRQALCEAGILSEKASRDADTVWRRGSTAVHYDPHVTHEVLETVQLTLSILSELYGART